MRQMNYEKPEMKKVSLKNENVIASNCWHEAANEKGKKWYYDYNEGELGYLEFEIAGECSGNGTLLNVVYLPEEIGKTHEALEAEAKLNRELKTLVKEQFGEYGILDDPTKVS